MRDNMLLIARMRSDEMTRQAGQSRRAARVRATARHEAPRVRTARRPVRWLVGGKVSRAR
ncbi:MAG TPA: hypothetical protein VFV73_05055 [Streptosporangiaceae bacterium]|nr:hypothetical protein [Streptosporangiaceae bacterium]